MVTCTECNKTFRKESGLRWHLNNPNGPHAGMSEGGRQVTPRQSDPSVEASERIDDLEGRLIPIEGLVAELSNKLNELTDKIGNLAERVEFVTVTKAMMDAQVDEFSKRLTDLREAHNRQAAVTNNHRDTFNNNFAVLGARIDKLQKVIDGLAEDLSAVRAKLATHGHDDPKSIPELIAKVGKIDQALNTMKSQVDYLDRVTKREPTGNMVQVTLTDGKEHTFREYKSTRGLTKPHKSSTDLLFGGRWVDLAEPED